MKEKIMYMIKASLKLFLIFFTFQCFKMWLGKYFLSLMNFIFLEIIPPILFSCTCNSFPVTTFCLRVDITSTRYNDNQCSDFDRFKHHDGIWKCTKYSAEIIQMWVCGSSKG